MGNWGFKKGWGLLEVSVFGGTCCKIASAEGGST